MHSSKLCYEYMIEVMIDLHDSTHAMTTYHVSPRISPCTSSKKHIAFSNKNQKEGFPAWYEASKRRCVLRHEERYEASKWRCEGDSDSDIGRDSVMHSCAEVRE